MSIHDVSWDEVRQLMDQSVGPHVNLGQVFGKDAWVEASGLADAIQDCEGGWVRLGLDGDSVTVSRQDGGVLATLEIRW